MSKKGSTASTSTCNSKDSGASEEPNTSKKCQHPPVFNKLNPYSRTKIMNQLVDKGYDPHSCASVVNKLRVNPEEAAQFINDKASAAQDHAHEECDSNCYKNISNWLDYYKEKNYHNESNFESAMIMIAISDMEHHPDPKETGGVDFQKIYKFLGDVMLGNPTPELNPESKNFLGQEFESLITIANTVEGDNDTKELRAGIEFKSRQIIPEMSTADKKRRKEFGSLDPMGIDKFISSTKRDKKPH